MTEASQAESGNNAKRFSRCSFLGGVAGGAAGAWGLSHGIDRFGRDPFRPPDLYEYFVDNFWFKTVDLYGQKINPPLKGKHKADIVIIGGGFTGLASAYHLIKRFPDKKIVLLEGACCGYGASGRNGGFATPSVPGIGKYMEEAGRELGRKAFDATRYGMEKIKEMIVQDGIECDFEENGVLMAAMDEDQAELLQKEHEEYKEMGLKTTLVQGKELEAEVQSPRYLAGLNLDYGAIVNPAKLARGMKDVVEAAGVEVRERTVVMRVTPGKTHRIETEMGEIIAPTLVLGLNGYSHKIGFFKNRVIPLSNYMVATEPLTKDQWESIGWQNRRGIFDMRLHFDYMRPTADGRIAIGGSDEPYYANDELSSGNNKRALGMLTKSLFTTFPQLEGLRIDHAWGGTMGFTIDFTPSVGVMGDHNNIYYGVAYNGQGVVFAQSAARIITDLMAGESSDLTDLFVVNRKLAYAGPQSMRVIPWNLTKWYYEKTTSSTVK